MDTWIRRRGGRLESRLQARLPAPLVAHALLRAAAALLPTLGKRSHECERGTHECARHNLVVFFLCVLLASCGYHVAGQADMVPKNIHSIAIPAFANLTTRYKLTDHLPQAISHEFIARTRYQIITDPQAADAILRGAVINYVAYPSTIDQQTGRASGLQVNVTMQISLVERATGKVLFTRPSFDVHQRYEISQTAGAYFEESDAALDRLSRDVARDVVSAILENF